jgi:hypothetical protein
MFNRYRRAHYVDTIIHKCLVFWYVLKACHVLLRRAIVHDLSKFYADEVRGFERARPIFERAEYGSDEYQEALGALGPSLRYHYERNMHHPEHFDGNVSRMSPLDQIEMLCDWKAACMRKRGDFVASLEYNAERFGLGDEILGGYLSVAGEVGLE